MTGPTLAPPRRTRRLPRWPWVPAAGGVALQMTFPLTGGGSAAAAVAVVVLLAGAALAHALTTRGPRAAAALLVVAGGGSLVVEAVGVATGYPFGTYAYSGSLGPAILGVPLPVPLAWVMIAYPSLLVARRLTRSVAGRWAAATTVVVAAWTMTTWDVFLDPQMVDAGHWSWRHPTPALPGVADVPLTNYAGWLAVSLVLCAALHVLVPVPRHAGADLMPHLLVLWTYASSVLADLAFFGRPGVAVAGGIAMGVVAVPLAVVVASRRGSPR